MSSEERLALRAAQGDRSAFEEIYNRYHQDLYRFCLAMLGNPQDAQDALQNTMVKVLRNLPGEKREIKLKPWLYRIARNESVETLRKRRDTAELEPQQMPVAAVTETAETRERLRTLLADLEQLPERQRAALVMRELAGLDFEQIGAAFDSSAAVARQTLYEARLGLRQLEAGREMRCADVMIELSNADGRVTRRRDIRAHLRSCADCRTFRGQIGKRHEDLAALAPLPLAASAGLLQGVLSAGGAVGAAGGGAAGGGAGAGAVGGVGGGLGGVGVGAGKAIATSALVKSAATAAVVAVVGVSAADRTGVIDLPLPGRGDDAPAKGASQAGGSGVGNAAGNAGMTDAAGRSGEASPGSRDADGADAMGKNGGALNGKDPTQRSPSRSQAGQAPPGGGYGRSAAERQGRPDSLPTAANKGQETAASKKPPQATSPPSQADAPSQAKSPSREAPTTPPQSRPPPAPAAEPSAQSPKSEAGAPQQGQEFAPPGHER
jgi:RNA polymerase sigma factor (sigma-70 family)